MNFREIQTVEENTMPETVVTIWVAGYGQLRIQFDADGQVIEGAADLELAGCSPVSTAWTLASDPRVEILGTDILGTDEVEVTVR